MSASVKVTVVPSTRAMLWRFVVVVLVAAAAAFGLSGGASAATWLAPITLTSSDIAVAADVATAGAGAAVAVWDREVGSACPDQPANPACVHVVEVRSRPGAGADWQAPVEIARPGIGSAPQVALDSAGDAVVLWSHDIGVDRVLQASLRHGPTGAWSEPVDLSEPSPSIGAHAVALTPGGGAFAIWTDATGVNAAIRPPSSGVWGAPVRLSRPGGAAPAGARLAVDEAGDAIVAWSAGGVVQAAYERVGYWWPAVDLGVGASPAVAIGAFGTAMVAWADGETVRVAKGGGLGNWTVPLALGTGADPAVAFDADADSVVAWSNAGEIEASFHEGYSPSWTQPEPLGHGSQPQVVLTEGGNAVATWLDVGVRAALRAARLGAWLPTVGISGEGASDLRLAGDGSGAQALWRRGAQVETAELVAAGPVLTRLHAPLDGVVGDDLSFSVDVVPWTAPLAGDPTWTFGDGAAATGGFVMHAYAAPGTYEVAVTELDAAGGRATATTEVTIHAESPVALTRPSIRGRPRVGATLTCVRGRWAGTPPIRYAFAWLRGTRAISGARRPTYRIRPHDRNRALACRVTATNGAGSNTSTSRAVRVSSRR
jgi:hypothetical protein